jgi:hypothetical protein
VGDPRRQKHICGHADGEAAILVVDAYPNLERLDVTLGPADVPLRREPRVDAAINHDAPALFS